MRREQTPQTILLQNKVENQITYLSRILNGNAEEYLTPVKNIEAVNEALKNQGIKSPSKHDIIEKQLVMLKTIHEKILDEAAENYRDIVLIDKTFFQLKSRIIPSLKNKGIPDLTEVPNPDLYNEFNTLFKTARKTSELNKENNHLSTTEVNFGIFVVGRNKSTTDTVKWELGSKPPQNNNLIKYACDFMNVDKKTRDRLIELREKTVQSGLSRINRHR